MKNKKAPTTEKNPAIQKKYNWATVSNLEIVQPDDDYDILLKKNMSEVFEMINNDIHVTSTIIADRLGISIATTKRKVESLKDAGYIKHIGSSKADYWKVLKDSK